MANPISFESLEKKGLINDHIGMTQEGGLYIWLLNKTGALSKKGTVVIASPVADNAFAIAPANSVSPMGVVVDNDVPDGALCRVTVSGMTYALLKNGESSTSGYWCGVSDTAGRIYVQPDPPSTSEHDREVGHCLQTVTGGTDKLVKIVVHFR